jgi:hypothetical protein
MCNNAKFLVGMFALIAIIGISVGFSIRSSEVIENEYLKWLNHRQDVWVHALEWCESRGFNNAVNPNDLDGTPSYGAFQFKPSTFDHYLSKYGMASSTLMNYESQKEIVRKMIGDPDVVWEQEFPNCVKNKIGLPPTI